MNNIAIPSTPSNPIQMPPQNSSLNITQPIPPQPQQNQSVMHPQASSNNGKLTISNLNPQQQQQSLITTHADPQIPQNPRNPSLKNDTNQQQQQQPPPLPQQQQQHHANANAPTPTNNNMSMSGGSIVNSDSLLQQLEMKSSHIHQLPMPPMGGKPSVLSLMPNYEDPVEQSLASLEQPMLKNDIDGMQNHMDLMNDMSSIISKQEGVPNNMPSHQSLMLPHLAYDNMQHNHGGNNGFGIDSPLTMNGMNMGGMVGNHLSMLGMPAMGLNALTQPTSIFDPLPQGGVHRSNASSVASMPIVQTTSVNIRKEEKFILTPKPIEELMNPSHDKKTSPIDGKGGAGFVHAINKLDHNLKNASSWSSLAAAGSPQNPLTSSKSKPPAMDSFQQFRNKAKEKMDRQKMLEQQELRRTQKEAAEKRNQEQQKHVKQRDEAEVPAR